MRTSKKLFSVAVAIVMGLGISLPTSVAASNESLDTVSYDPCDVNHDGSVDIMDVIRLNKYLGGIEAVLHTNYLDANGNKIVDIADTEMVLAEVVNTSYIWGFFDITSNSSAAFSSVDPENRTVGDMTELPWDSETFDSLDLAESESSVTRDYIRFKTSQPTTLFPYSLTTTYNSNSKDFPLRANSDYSTSVGESETGIVRLVRSSEHISGSNFSTYHGTGFIIDDHRIVTAAHCIYHDTDNDNKADSNEFYSDLQIQMCNSNGVLTSTTYNVKEIHIPNQYATGPNKYLYDYALLTVSSSLPSTTYKHYTLGTPVDVTSSGFTSINLFISGFPQDAGSANPSRVYTSKGHGISSSTSNWLQYNNHDYKGLSGSPVYTATRYKVGTGSYKKIYTAVAINSYKFKNNTGGTGPTFDEFLLTFFMQGSTNVGY